MACFDDAIGRTIEFEVGPFAATGGYVWDKQDPGGETKWGISKRAHPDVNIKALTREQACAIYKRDYWNPLYDKLTSQELAAKLFDLGVNMGPTTAVRLLQGALRKLGHPVKADGLFGAKTLAAANASDERTLQAAFSSRAARYYGAIVTRKPEQAKFLTHWLSRALDGIETK